MVHSSVSVQKSPIDVRPPSSVGSGSGASHRQPPTTIRRKRLSEPRPHPSHCLNKRFWDEVRAGRLPKPQTSTTTDPAKEKRSPTSGQDTKMDSLDSGNSVGNAMATAVINTANVPDLVGSRKRSSTETPNSPPTVPRHHSNQPSTSTASSTSSSSNPSNSMPPQPLFGIPSASQFSRFPFGFPPPMSAMPPAMSFWGFMPAPTSGPFSTINGMPYPMAPHGFMPMPSHPYMMPYMQPMSGSSRAGHITPNQFQPMPTAPQSTRQPSPDHSSTIHVDGDEPNNNDSPHIVPEPETQIHQAPPQIQYVPIPVPIPIPLSTDFVMKHFGR